MGDINSPVPPTPPRVRIWPAFVFVAVQWVGMIVPRLLVPGTEWQFYGMMAGPMVGLVGVLVWWMFASRVPWLDRFLGLAAFVAVGAAAFPLLDASFDGFGVYMAIVPMVVTVVVLSLLLSLFLGWRTLRVAMLVAMVLTWGYFLTLRFDHLTGVFVAHFEYRWTPTHEQNLAANEASKKLAAAKPLASAASKPLVLAQGDWPGFRGANRDGRVTGVKIATDWTKNPPKRLWHHLVGAGWSSFAVVGKHFFTQEQLQDEELVVCYDALTGEVIWAHRDKTRFSERVGGDGPRATPTFHEGKLYVLGATGKLNCLDAATGNSIWAQDIAADSGAKVPIWGFSSSPLVVKDIVTVFAGGPDGKSVLAYKAATGEPVWQAGEGTHSYCSMQPATLCGVEQLVVATEKGLIAFQPTSGEVLWKHEWPFGDLQRVVQPTILNDSDVLLGTGFGKGTKRIRVSNENNTWATTEVWTSRAISPYFNDLVIHNGHIYGFEGDFFTCVDLETGKKKWRERGYGNGQVLLLADQGLLLILSEEGEVALIEAAPEAHKEIGRFQALPGKGRTWNHPVVAHGMLFVRNGAEAACYQLTESGAGK